MIVAAAIAPHGTPAFDPGPTRDALEEIGRRFAAAAPETIVVVTPHNVHVSGHFAVVDAATVAGSLAEWGEPERTLDAHGRPATWRPRVVATAGPLPIVSASPTAATTRRPPSRRWTGGR